MKRFLLFCAIAIQSACSVFNPNPGENEADQYLASRHYEEAIALVEPLAQQGIPWAQLRFGIMNEYGYGLPKNQAIALDWYRQVARKTEALPWADGVHLLSTGTKGYFNQNQDARVAQYLIARLYSEGSPDVPKNLEQAWLWANYVRHQSQGKDILYCCENSRLKSQWIEYSRIEQLLLSIESGLSTDQKDRLQKRAASWLPD